MLKAILYIRGYRKEPIPDLMKDAAERLGFDMNRFSLWVKESTLSWLALYKGKTKEMNDLIFIPLHDFEGTIFRDNMRQLGELKERSDRKNHSL